MALSATAVHVSYTFQYVSWDWCIDQQSKIIVNAVACRDEVMPVRNASQEMSVSGFVHQAPPASSPSSTAAGRSLFLIQQVSSPHSV